MKFFVPDWDDRVDPGYDFLSDRPTLKRNPHLDDVYAHELFTEPVYDGVLVSLMAVRGAGPKRTYLERYGLRRYLRLPTSYELFGDCGAFGYIAEDAPAVTTEEAIREYHLLGVDYAVSVDHIIVPEFHHQREQRLQVTINNAKDFIVATWAGGYQFTPIGAVQGWDPASYVVAARRLVELGYDYIALGGLARSNTDTIREVVVSVREAIPRDTRIHVFGVARLTLLPLFHDLGITSVDSAAPLRQAWLSARENYYVLEGTYAAIRIPVAHDERPKADTLVSRSTASLGSLQAGERAALAAIRAYDRRELDIEQTLATLIAYDTLLAARLDVTGAKQRHRLYRQTLKDRPWQKCPCQICRALGVDVIVFRGNNRNRRRGFHNLWIVRKRLGALAGDPGALPSARRRNRPVKLPLPLSV